MTSPGNPTRKLRDALSSLNHEPGEVFPEGFMREYTCYGSFEEFLEENGWVGSEGSIPFEITVGDANEVVRKTTNFQDWREMLDRARNSLWDHPGRNRRRFKRYDCNLPVRFEMGVDQTLNGTVVDLSRNGLGLETNEDPPTARTLTVELLQDGNRSRGGSLKLRGAVRWRHDNGPVRMGVELLEKAS